MRLFAWGTNVGALPESDGDLGPRDVTPPGFERVVFHSWACTVLQTTAVTEAQAETDSTRAGGELHTLVWSDPSLRLEVDVKELRGGRLISQLDVPVAALVDRRLRSTKAGSMDWDDVAVTDVGTVLAYRATGGLYTAATLADLLEATPLELSHLAPLLASAKSVVLAAGAQRAWALVQPGGHVLSVDWNYRQDGLPASVSLVDELEGLGVVSLTCAADRAGVVTEAGEAYVLSEEIERVVVAVHGRGDEENAEQDAGDEQEDEGEGGDDFGDVQHLALGMGFDVAVVDGNVYARGNNEFGQLGQGHCLPVRGWIEISLPPVKQLHASRFSVLAVVD